MANLNAGTLNRRVSIQTQSMTQDAFGGLLPVWTTAYECWASIAVQNSELLYSTAEFVAKVTYRITVRWTPEFVFTPSQRVVYIDQASGITHTYEIKSLVNEMAANKQVMLLCYELGGTE